MTTRSSIVLLALLIALTWSVPPARAADQVVTDCGDNGGAGQLRAKITAAQSSGGGTITFACGPAIIVLQSQLPVINSLLTIDGGGTIQLSGGNTVRVLFVTAGVLTLRNITVRNGWAGNPGGAIRVSTAGLEAFDTVFQDSTSTDEGGAIDSDYSNLELGRDPLRASRRHGAVRAGRTDVRVAAGLIAARSAHGLAEADQRPRSRARTTCSTSPHTASPCLRNRSTSAAGAHAVTAAA